MTAFRIETKRPVNSDQASLVAIVRGGIVACVGLGFVAALAGLIDRDFVYAWGGAFVAAGLLTIWGCLGWLWIRREPGLLLTPWPLLCLFAALTFGFGPLVNYLGPEAVQQSIEARWGLTDLGLFRVHVMNLVGSGCVMAGALVGLVALKRLKIKNWLGKWQAPHMSDRGWGQRGSWPPDRLLLRVALFCLGLSVALRALQWGFDVHPFHSLPAFLSPVERIGWAGILVAAVLAGRHWVWLWLLVLPGLVLEVTAGALSLDRLDMLMPPLLVLLGLYISRRRWRLLVLGLVLIGLFYIPLRGIVDIGRHQVWSRGVITAAEFWRSATDNSLTADAVISQTEEGGWWTRWDYSPVQHTLMEEYDEGRSANTYWRSYWLFVPRVLVPGKPSIQYGKELGSLIQGRPLRKVTVSVGPSVFGEAYWNGGWASVVGTSLVYGMIVALVANSCLWLFSETSAWAWLIGLHGILTGVLVRNFFTVGVVGGTLAFYTLAGLYCVYQRVAWAPTNKHISLQYDGT